MLDQVGFRLLFLALHLLLSYLTVAILGARSDEPFVLTWFPLRNQHHGTRVALFLAAQHQFKIALPFAVAVVEGEARCAALLDSLLILFFRAEIIAESVFG